MNAENRWTLAKLRTAVMLVAGGSLVAALAAVMVSHSGSEAASPQEVLRTPEGATIEVYTTLVSAEDVYAVLRANAASLDEIGPTLTVAVDEYADAGSGYASYSANSSGQFVSRIKLVAESFVLAPHSNMGHEYGHVYGWYYKWKLWGGSWSSYLKARGLLGETRLDSSYAWDVDEIFAEDYRQLLASEKAWQESPYQFNSQIPPASQVPGLGEFFCTTWPGKTANDWTRCSASPAPAPTAEPTPTPTPAPTPTPTPTPKPTPVSTPTPTASAGADPTPTPTPTTTDSSFTVTVAGGWRTFAAPASGTTDVTVYFKKAKGPTSTVVQGKTYWAKGPVTITITP